MNPKQYTTEDEAKKVLAVHGPQSAGGMLFIPEYFGAEAPSMGERKFYHVAFNNGYTSNAGLLLDNIERYGEKMAKVLHAANMKFEGRWVLEA